MAVQPVRVDLHPSQHQILRERKRFNTLCCGRRFGKTRIAFALAIEAVTRRIPVVYFTPSSVDYEKRWYEAEETFHPILKSKLVSEGVMTFTNGIRMDWFGMHRYDGARGNRYGRALVDEAAHSPNLKDAWTKVMRPALADFKGDAYFMSTPNGDNFFKELYDTNHPDYMAWRMPTSANPYIDPSEIEAARLDPNMPDAIFRQEYLAEFVSLSGALVRREHMKHCDVLPDMVFISMGVDLATSKAESADYTAIVVAGRDASGNIYIMDAWRDRVGALGNIKAVKEMAAKWNPHVIRIEAVQYQVALSDELIATTSLPIQPITPKHDKRTRFIPTWGKYEKGMIYHRRGLTDYENELLTFDGAGRSHDDMVDAAVYAIDGLQHTELRIY